MNLVLNRPHSKANELKVGTGEALALGSGSPGLLFAYRRGTNKLSARYEVAPPASCALGRVA